MQRARFLPDFNQISISSTDLDFLCRFSQKPSISNLTEVCPVGSAMLHIDRWTDITKATGILCNHANATINGRVIVE
jgi:hypothetical protein